MTRYEYLADVHWTFSHDKPRKNVFRRRNRKQCFHKKNSDFLDVVGFEVSFCSLRNFRKLAKIWLKTIAQNPWIITSQNEQNFVEQNEENSVKCKAHSGDDYIFFTCCSWRTFNGRNVHRSVPKKLSLIEKFLSNLATKRLTTNRTNIELRSITNQFLNPEMYIFSAWTCEIGHKELGI